MDRKHSARTGGGDNLAVIGLLLGARQITEPAGAKQDGICLDALQRARQVARAALDQQIARGVFEQNRPGDALLVGVEPGRRR